MVISFEQGENMERSLLNAPDWLLALLLAVLLGWAAVGLFRDANRWIRFFFPKYHRRTRSDDAVDEAFLTEAERNAPPPEGLPPRSIAICGSGEIPRFARCSRCPGGRSQGCRWRCISEKRSSPSRCQGGWQDPNTATFSRIIRGTGRCKQRPQPAARRFLPKGAGNEPGFFGDHADP